MQALEASLSEYTVVMQMFGVGPALGPRLMAEIRDVRRAFIPRKRWCLMRALTRRRTSPSRRSQPQYLKLRVVFAAQNLVSGDVRYPSAFAGGRTGLLVHEQKAA